MHDTNLPLVTPSNPLATLLSSSPIKWLVIKALVASKLCLYKTCTSNVRMSPCSIIGGIAAGIISDQLKARAIVCVIYLLLAIPFVSVHVFSMTFTMFMILIFFCVRHLYHNIILYWNFGPCSC